jgi:pyruvate kinase
MFSARTKIVATMGPAIETEEMIKALIIEGVDVFRINSSHGNQEQRTEYISRIRKVAKDLDNPVAILLDLQGPKIRVGEFDKPVILKDGDTFIIRREEVKGDNTQCSVSYSEIVDEMDIGMKLMINDGLIILKVVKKEKNSLITEVLVGGEVSTHKGLNIPDANLDSIPALTDKDLDDLKFGLNIGVDYIAISFVRNATDIDLLRWEMKKVIKEHTLRPYIIAKIEKPQAVNNIDSILDKVEGIMVARGDLGVEIDITMIPNVQKKLINKANDKGKIVITATQMLDSMTHHYTPTRAEVTDVANAILDGTDAVMLSGETSVGKYPVHTVKVMNDIILHTESNMTENSRNHTSKPLSGLESDTESTLAESVCLITQKLDIKAVACFTNSGYTSRLLSKVRPNAPIIAYCLNEHIKRKLNLIWGTFAKVIDQPENFDELVEVITKDLLENEGLKKGDNIIIVSGVPINNIKQMNTIKINQL